MTDSQLPACESHQMDARWCTSAAAKPMKPDVSPIQPAACHRVNNRLGLWRWMATVHDYWERWVAARKNVKMSNSHPTDNLQSGQHENNCGLRRFQAPPPLIN